MKVYFFKLCGISLIIAGLVGCAGDFNWPKNLSGANVFSRNKGPIVPSEAVKPTTAPVKVALLVPLSGKYADVGKQLFDAAQLALFHFNNPNLELIPIDTKDTTRGIEEAAQKAVDEHVALILGPLFSDATRIVTPIAAKANIQVVSFSNDKNLVGTGAFIIGLRPEQQIARVVQYANTHYGVERMGLLLPEGASGEVMQKAAFEVVTEYNKRVALVKTELYPAKSDNEAAIGEHTHAIYTALLNSPEPQRSYYKKGALFIAEGGANAKKIGQALSTEGGDKKQIQLMGTMLWYDPALLGVPGMEGAIFATLSQEQQQYFEQKLFMNTYYYKPKPVASLAYDGVALAATLSAVNNGVISREMLANPRGFVGVNGVFRLNNNGLAERGLEVMEIQSGKFAVIDPAPRSFVQ